MNNRRSPASKPKDFKRQLLICLIIVRIIID